jgi:regulator of protease activity HflC (stomatin/prohibitin superfamily)
MSQNRPKVDRKKVLKHTQEVLEEIKNIEEKYRKQRATRKAERNQRKQNKAATAEQEARAAAAEIKSAAKNSTRRKSTWRNFFSGCKGKECVNATAPNNTNKQLKTLKKELKTLAKQQSAVNKVLSRKMPGSHTNANIEKIVLELK